VFAVLSEDGVCRAYAPLEGVTVWTLAVALERAWGGVSSDPPER
jgi:hypothetical protein